MKNWKTTLAGILGAILIGIVPVLQSGKISVEALAIAAVVAVGGLLQKDHNVTGGTVINEPNDPAVVKDAAKKDA